MIKSYTSPMQGLKVLVKASKIVILFLALLMLSNSTYARRLWTYKSPLTHPWDGSNTWTNTTGGDDLIGGPYYPEANDTLYVVGVNTKLYLVADVDLTGLTIYIQEGILDLTDYTFSQPIILYGPGTLKIKNSSLPTISNAHFFQNTGYGGTVEYYDFTGNISTTQATYYNLTLSGSGGETITINRDIEVLGSLNITRTGLDPFYGEIGGDATVRTVIVRGDININSSSTFGVGAFNAVHSIDVYGNISNDGTLALTNNLTQYAVSTTGAAILTFKGGTNNEFSGTGTQRIYRMIVDKGSGQTYSITVNPENFSLYYPTSGAADDKALRLINGTLILGENVSIPKLADEETALSSSNFVIPANAHLKISGATVNITDADGDETNTGITIQGKLTVTDGTLSTQKSIGITLLGGQLLVQGGTLEAAQINSSGSSTLNISGGTITLNEVALGGNPNTGLTTLSIPATTDNFNMSGGTLNIYSTTTGAAAIGSSSYTASGGTVNIYTSGTNAFASTSPMYDLNILNGGTLSLETVSGVDGQELVVNNNLTINGSTLLTNNFNVKVGRNFTVSGGGVYTYGTNTTEFFRYSGNTTNSATVSGVSTLNNVSLNKSDAVSNYNNAKTTIFSSAVDIEGSLSFDANYQTLNLSSTELKVQGNVSVNRISRIINDNGILLQPDTPVKQTLTIGKLSTANSFELDNTMGARLSESAAMGTLTLTNGSLYIGNKTLTLSNPLAGAGFGEDKMVSTNGLSGEIKYIYSGSGANTYLYPVGTGAAPPDGEEEFTESEDFSRDVFSTSPQWTSTLINGAINWVVGAGSALFDGSVVNQSARMETPVMDLSAYSSITLNFREQRPKVAGGIDQLAIYYDNGSGWTLITTYSDQQDAFVDRSLDLPNLSATYKVGFRAIASNKAGTYTRVDDVELTNLQNVKKYTPFTMTLAGTGNFSTSQNTIGVIPVNSYHPGATDPNNPILMPLYYYWKVSTSLPDGPPADLTVEYLFTNTYDVLSGGGNWAWRLVSNVWTKTVDYTEPDITFTNVGFTAGEFTAGKNNAFVAGGGLTVYYSRNAVATWDWDVAATWSTDPDLTHDGAQDGGIPALGDYVIIAPGHNVVVTNNTKGADYILINSGGILDVGTTTGHTFDIISGQGTFRVASATIPQNKLGVYDNFNDFLTTDFSTFEYYGGAYSIPSTFATYYNLTVSGAGAKPLPTADLTIRNNLTVNTATVTISNAADGDIEIANKLTVENSGTLAIPATANVRAISAGDVEVNNATFSAAAGGGATHTLSVDGGSLDAVGTGTISLYNANNNVDVTMSGPSNATIGSSGRPVSINRLTVAKDNLYDTLSVTAELQLAAPSSGTSIDLTSGTLVLESTAGTPMDIVLSDNADFSIPETAALIVQGTGNAVSTTNGGDIWLDGLFRLDATGEANIDGDIKYTNSGSAALKINGTSALDVGGQLMQNGTGTLSFTQTGGTATIGSTSAADNTHGVFEVVGDGSTFTYSGGTLTISRSSGYAQGDILLEPDNFDVAAGATLNIQAAAAGQTITINSSSPLSSLNIASDNNPTVTPMIRRLVLMGDFINAATYESNDLSLSLEGDFNNSGTFTSTALDTTIFTGDIQTLTNSGSATFLHLLSEPTTSLTFNDAITIEGNLTISSGEFADGGNTITALGNVYNQGTHTGGGKIYFNGTNRQDICGSGSYANIDIDNPQGARLVNTTNITGDLLMTEGILNIQSYLLNLGESTSITPVGDAFSASKMIQSNGTVADEALQKNFSSSYSGTFIFPVGTYLKYRPITMIFDVASDGGLVKVYPVNSAHPNITASGDPTRTLNYYWGLVSEISGFTGDIVFKFEDVDLGSAATLSEFYSAQLVLATDSWLKAELPQTDIDDRTITFSFTGANSEAIDGSFTCGENDAIPDVVLTYSSVKTGDWDDPTVWDRAVVPPQGSIVVVQAIDTVSINTDNKRPYRIRINGRLWIKPGTVRHNFGLVQGTGILALEAGVIPPGKWSQSVGGIPGFIPTVDACGTGYGTVEYGGTSSYTLDANYTRYYNLTIAGSGTKTMPSSNMNICGDLRIENSVTLKQPGVALGYRYTSIIGDTYLCDIATWDMSNRTWIIIFGDLNKDNTARLNTFYSYNDFQLTGSDNININGSFTGVNKFRNLRFEKSAIVKMNGPAEIDIFMYLINNNRVQTSSLNLLTVNYALGLTGTVNGIVEGPIKIRMGNTTTNKYLPVGKNNIRKFIYPLDLPATVGYWTGEYFNTSPSNHSPAMSHLSYTAPVMSVSQTEYWHITGPNTVGSRIKLTLSGTSDIAAGVSTLANLRIVYWNGSSWEVAGTSATVTGTALSGTIETTGNITFNGNPMYFTIGAVETVVVNTAQITSTSTTICSGGSTDLEITFTGTSPWSINLSDGQSFAGITDNPEYITVSPASTTTYSITSVNGGTGLVLGGSVIVTVAQQPSLFDIGGGGAVCGISTTSITLSGSQVGFTYYLYRDGAYTMQLAGTGSALSFSPISIAGTYHIEAFQTGYPGCPRTMNGTTVVTIVPTSTLNVNSVDPLTVCDGETVTVFFDIVASATFDFRLNESFSGRFFDLDETLVTLIAGTTYSYSFSAVWLDQANPTPGLAQFVYTVTNFTDTSGCDTQITGSASLDVYKIPETGPQYHIPNTFGE